RRRPGAARDVARRGGRRRRPRPARSAPPARGGRLRNRLPPAPGGELRLLRPVRRRLPRAAPPRPGPAVPRARARAGLRRLPSRHRRRRRGVRRRVDRARPHLGVRPVVPRQRLGAARPGARAARRLAARAPARRKRARMGGPEPPPRGGGGLRARGGGVRALPAARPPGMTPLPWARPRFERLLLLLVACAALSPVYLTSTQDVTRLCLTRSLVQGKLTVTPCVGSTIDRAVYHGRTYTDKAPGQSLLALPAVEAVRLPPASEWTFEGDPKLWAVRVLVTGVAFLLLAWAVGRLSEGLAPGFGGAALVTFALGTLVAPLAASSFDHDLTAAFGFAAFLLAWRGSPGWAGLCAGLAVLCEYQGAATAVVVAAFVALRGAGALARYALAALPPLALLGAYDWAAFGSPFHLSYRYVANRYSADSKPASSASTCRAPTRPTRSSSATEACSSRRPCSSPPRPASRSSRAATPPPRSP